MDWQVGDLVVCVDAAPKPWNDIPQLAALKRLEIGRTYRVSAIGLVGSWSGPTIMLHGCTSTYDHLGMGWTASRFRKIRPDERKACEPEFVTLIKRAKRPVSA
jgi:hypothetical protein